MATPTTRIRVKRYRPERARDPYYETYEVPFRRDMVVLDALNYVKDRLDGSLAFRWSCRMGVCGSCGAMVNGKPRLTCNTFLKEFRGGEITVDPLANFPVYKDLVVDVSDFLRKLVEVKPWIIRGDERPLWVVPGKERVLSEGEYRQTPAELELYRPQSMCINCMLCYAACPVYGGNPHFLGPAALALAYRYDMDSRDQGKEARRPVIMSQEAIWECTLVEECSVVCPKDVDPAMAIQRLKTLHAMDTVLSVLMPRKGRTP